MKPLRSGLGPQDILTKWKLLNHWLSELKQCRIGGF
jgi:hypothetical protein